MFTSLVSEISGEKFANGAVTGAFVHLFNNWAGKAASFGAKKSADSKIENLNEESKTIIRTSIGGFVGGIVGGVYIGATALSVMGPLGMLIGGVAGGTYGLASGLFAGYMTNRLNRSEGFKIIKGTTEGYIEYEKRRIKKHLSEM
ncbi:MAG: hypothetical protein ACNI25_03900 [Halarcobacter sp.]